jgi:uncharacterized membrane protein
MNRTGRQLLAAAMLIGAGLGGFVDAIVFHQLLQWHNMVSGWLPPGNLVDAKINMFWDGVFHAAVWCMTAVGIGLLWRVAAGTPLHGWGRVMVGGCLLGWGLFNTVEGLIDHLVLGIHHVNEYVFNPLPYDLLFQLSGIVLMAVGWAPARKGRTSAPDS